MQQAYRVGDPHERAGAGVTNATFMVYGASGGDVLKVTRLGMQVVSSGGAGGEAKAKFAVEPGQMYEIVVGGRGGAGTVNSSTGQGGFNGGGDGYNNTAGGGGGSDVRREGRGNTCLATQQCGYADRIVVAGGGGGAGGPDPIGQFYPGYAGGGLSGQDGGGNGAGTQESPGTCSSPFAPSTLASASGDLAFPSAAAEVVAGTAVASPAVVAATSAPTHKAAASPQPRTRATRK
jgi:hypothetical protein